ncbi:MAG: response regulator [Solirubrobacterales bacterium]
MGKILIIEESILVRHEIRKALESGGYLEITELNSADSVSKLPELYLNDAILIILDVDLPGIRGIDLAHTLKAHPKYSVIPIIFVSGNNHYKAVSEAINAGGADYIVKPFNPEFLVERVKNAINHFNGVHKTNSESDYKKIMNSIVSEFERATCECIDLDFLIFISENDDIEQIKNLIENSNQEIYSVLKWKDRIIIALPFESEKSRLIFINNIKEKMVGSGLQIEYSKVVSFKFSEENDLQYLKKELLE